MYLQQNAFFEKMPCINALKCTKNVLGKTLSASKNPKTVATPPKFNDKIFSRYKGPALVKVCKIRLKPSERNKWDWQGWADVPASASRPGTELRGTSFLDGS
jgi:hypothetical protein